MLIPLLLSLGVNCHNWFRVYSSGAQNRLLSGQKEALWRCKINKINQIKRKEEGKKAGSVFRHYFVSLQCILLSVVLPLYKPNSIPIL